MAVAANTKLQHDVCMSDRIHFIAATTKLQHGVCMCDHMYFIAANTMLQNACVPCPVEMPRGLAVWMLAILGSLRILSRHRSTFSKWSLLTLPMDSVSASRVRYDHRHDPGGFLQANMVCTQPPSDKQART